MSDTLGSSEVDITDVSVMLHSSEEELHWNGNAEHQQIAEMERDWLM